MPRRKPQTRSGLRGAILLLLLILAAAHPPATGTAPAQLDQGTFTLYVKGARIGEERFVIRRESGGVSEAPLVSAAEIDLKLDGRTMRIRAALQTAGRPPMPRRYEAKINGSTLTTIVATLLADRVVLNIQSPDGEEMRQFLVRGKAAILDRHIAHHYYFACKLLGEATTTDISVIVPRDRAQYRLRIEDRGEDDVLMNGRQLRLRHLTMTDQTGIVRHVWLDGEKIMRVEVPADGFAAERSVSPTSTAQPLGGA